ncbi:BAR domain-containing protein, partial [Halopseudomonas salina]|uniref:hypothetical protein n=1 Tax=Halopseudomonas salina TaxID=1323744 RepID=UPI0016819F4B
ADSQLDRFSSKAKKAGLSLLAAFSVVAVSLKNKQNALATGQMVRLAELSGTTAEKFQGWAFASKGLRIEADKLGDIFKDVRDKVGDFLQTGGGPLADFFESIAPQVGVTADQFRDLSGPDALQLYVSSLEKANVSQNEMTFYMEAIASDAALLLPLLRDNGKEYERLAQQARELGLVMSEDVVQGAKAFERSANTASAVSEGLGQQLTAELGPAMNMFTGVLVDTSREGKIATRVAALLGAVIKVLGTAVLIAGDGFGALGRFIGGTAAAAVSAAKGDFTEAADIMRQIGEDNAQATGEMMGKIAKLWDGTYEQVGETASSVADQLEQSERRSTAAVVGGTEAKKKAYTDMVELAKGKIKELTDAERDANKDVEKYRDERLDIEKRYAEALNQLAGGGAGEASYGNAQKLKVNARNALQAGDYEDAQRQAQAALKMLLELQQAGENTYGFAGFAKELQDIELSANKFQQTDADEKLKAIKAELQELKDLTDLEIKPYMSPEAIKTLEDQLSKLGKLLGDAFVITPTLAVPESSTWNLTPDRTTNPKGYATGTPSAPPGLAWVGERGPELVAFGGGERVFTADASQRLASVLKGLRATQDDMGLTSAAMDAAENDFSAGAAIYLPDGRQVNARFQQGGLDELATYVRLAKLRKG